MGTTKDLEARNAMRDTVAELAPLVEAGLPARSVTAFAFARINPGHLDDYTPSESRMRAAIDAFEALAPEQQKAVCNGWSADGITDRPGRAELRAEVNEVERDASVVRLLLITSDGSCLRWMPSGEASPVSVAIRFGTTKADVLRELRRIEAGILDHFEHLVSNEVTSLDALDQQLNRELSQRFTEGSVVAA